VFTLADYVAAGIMDPDHAGALRDAVEARENIRVTGGTSSGKTTLTNARLAEAARPRIESCSSNTRQSFSARPQTLWRCVPRTA
jgi:hypothetical protein